MFLEMNENENTVHPDLLWDTMKVVLRGRVKDISLYIKKKNLHICNLATHMKAQEQRKQIILPKSR